MDATATEPRSDSSSSDSSTYNVNISWPSLNASVTESGDSKSDPVYTIGYHAFRAPHLVFKSEDGKEVGSGTIHAIDISPDYELHGVKSTIKAQKRFKTVYTYTSQAFSTTDSPVTMTWTSSCGMKTWDFVCVDENQLPVGKVTINVWAVKKLGKIELMGPAAHTKAARDEIAITGLTLFYCMWTRVNNPLNLVGSVIHRKD